MTALASMSTDEDRLKFADDYLLSFADEYLEDTRPPTEWVHREARREIMIAPPADRFSEPATNEQLDRIGTRFSDKYEREWSEEERNQYVKEHKYYTLAYAYLGSGESIDLRSEILPNVSPGDREGFLRVVADIIQNSKLPVHERRDFYEKFWERLRRGKRAIGESFRTLGTSLIPLAGEQARADTEFWDTLQGMRRGADPATSSDLFLRGLLGAAEMAPRMAASAAAVPVGGPIAGPVAFWISQIAPDRYNEYRQHGISEGYARSAAVVSAIPESLIEMLQVKQLIPQGLRRGAQRAATKSVAEFLKKYTAETGKTYAKEVGEEAVQAALGSASKGVAAHLDKEAPGVDWEQEIKGAAREVGEAALSIPFLMGPGHAIGGARGLSRAMRVQEGHRELEQAGQEIDRRLTPAPSAEQVSKSQLLTTEGARAYAEENPIIATKIIGAMDKAGYVAARGPFEYVAPRTADEKWTKSERTKFGQLLKKELQDAVQRQEVPAEEVQPEEVASQEIAQANQEIVEQEAEVHREMASRRPTDPLSPTYVAHGMTQRLDRGNVPKPISAVKVMESLTKVVSAFGSKAPIRVGEMAQQQALGIFKVHPEVVRIRTANDQPTAAHEVGHSIEKSLYGWAKGGPWSAEMVGKEAQQELLELGKALYNDSKPAAGYKREGFAEYIRLWLTDPTAAEEQVPAFYKWFEETLLPGNQPGRAALLESRRLIGIWNEEGATERARQSIVDLGSMEQRLGRLGKIAKKLTSPEIHIDIAHPLARMAKAAEKILGRELRPSEDPFFILSALRSTHAARTRVMVEEQMIDLAGNPVEGVAPLADIRAIVKERRTDFTIYLWAKRAVALWTDPQKPEGRNPGLSLADASRIITELETPQFQLAAQKVYDWNNAVLDYVAQASPSLQAVVQRIRAVDPGNYIPLSREYDELDQRISSISAKIGTASPIKRLRGSGRRIKDPFPQMIANAERLLLAAHNRAVVDAIIKLSRIEGMGHLIEKVPRGRAPLAVKSMKDVIDAVKQELSKKGGRITVEPGAADLAEEVVTLWGLRESPTGGKPIVPLWNGEEIEWYYLDPEVYKALSAMDVYRLPTVAGLNLMEWFFGKPTAVFRAGTTGLRASFGLVWNMMRDLPTAWANTQSNAHAGRMFLAWMQSMAEAGIYRATGKRSPYVDAFIRLGGEMAQPLSQDIAYTRRTARKLFQGRVIRTLDPHNWLDLYREFIQFPEMAPRMAELRLLGKEMGWEPGQPMNMNQSLRLLLATKQITTDFTAAGEFSRFWNRIAHFYNAAIQGPRANIRALRRNPSKFAAHGLQLTALTLLLWWLYKDEEWYTQMDWREKFLNWHVPFDWPEPGLARIPRPFEIGAVFAALPEMLIDAWYRQDPEGVKQWFKIFQQTATPNVTPPVAEEIYEQALNWDTFWNRPIVPRAEEDRPLEEQFNEYTSRASIWLGEKFNVSPRRIDHAIRGIGGPVAADIISVLGLGPKGAKRDSELADTWVIGRMFQRGGKLGNRPRVIGEFYEKLNELLKRSHSVRDPENKQEKQQRLLMQDAARALSALGFVKTQMPRTTDRQSVMREMMEIAESAINAVDMGREGLAKRGLFKAQKRRAEIKKKRVQRDVELLRAAREILEE